MRYFMLIALLLPDALVLDKENRYLGYSLNQLIRSWNETGVGQIMGEHVSLLNIESFGVADLGGLDIEPFKSIALNGLVEKPSAVDAP